jgi:hypothetical protein
MHKNNKFELATVQVVTGIFEIGREKIDGRSSNFYLEKIQYLLNVYPNAIVFHNLPENEVLEIKNKYRSCQIVSVKLNELPLFNYRDQIKHAVSIIKKTSATKDLVFSSIDYGIVVNSKPYLMLKAAELHQSEFTLWVDAGISRFYPRNQVPDIKFHKDFIPQKYIGMVDFDARNFIRNINILKMPKHWISYGSSTRIISAGAILLRTNVINEFLFKFMQNLLKNLDNNLWDTEQISILKVLRNFQFLYLIIGKKIPVSILRVFNNNIVYKYRILLFSWMINKII